VKVEAEAAPITQLSEMADFVWRSPVSPAGSSPSKQAVGVCVVAGITAMVAIKLPRPLSSSNKSRGKTNPASHRAAAQPISG
jgi:hypothetical protein